MAPGRSTIGIPSRLTGRGAGAPTILGKRARVLFQMIDVLAGTHPPMWYLPQLAPKAERSRNVAVTVHVPSDISQALVPRPKP